MRKLISFAKSESNHNIVRFGESLDPSPKFNLVQIFLPLDQLTSSSSDPQSTSRDIYLSSTLKLKPTVCSI